MLCSQIESDREGLLIQATSFQVLLFAICQMSEVSQSRSCPILVSFLPAQLQALLEQRLRCSIVSLHILQCSQSAQMVGNRALASQLSNKHQILLVERTCDREVLSCIGQVIARQRHKVL